MDGKSKEEKDLSGASTVQKVGTWDKKKHQIFAFASVL